ncbi:hypothetical protein ACF9IK_34585 [Kitasatospora hibisci]|uniref:hypothetical protein n=1 Tax=Kitasatospora hibisci TaxID=3369522 RepID=UPI003753F52A
MNYVSKMLGAPDISVTLARAAARRVYGHSNRTNPRAVPTSHRYRVEEVPPALPRALFDTHFAPLTERLPSVTYEMQRYLRRAASLRLAELISGGTWRQCATALAIPENSARQTLNVLGRAFAPDSLWPIFENVVDHIAQELDESDARVDYVKRRRLMAQWHLPADHHYAMCQDLRKLRTLREQSNPSPIEVLVWSAVTEAEYLHSPILRALRLSAEGGGRSLTLSIHRLVRPTSPVGGSLRLRPTD